jgi:hypothetical protein
LIPAFDRPRDSSYSAAEEKAWEDLIHLDSKNIAKNSLAGYDGRTFTLTVLDEVVEVDKWEGLVTSTARHDKFFEILVLHYLIGCHAGGPDGELVLFRQLKGGDAYNDTFHRRVNDRLAKAFGEDPEALARAGGRLNGTKRSKGNASVELLLFPKVPVTVIVWRGDEEVPASSTILFDRSIGGIFPTEDVAVAGSFIVEKLVRAKSEASAVSTDR